MGSTSYKDKWDQPAIRAYTTNWITNWLSGNKLPPWISVHKRETSYWDKGDWLPWYKYSGRQWCRITKWDSFKKHFTTVRFWRKSMYYITLVHGKNPCEFHGIVAILRWFLQLSHAAVAVPHHCHHSISEHDGCCLGTKVSKMVMLEKVDARRVPLWPIITKVRSDSNCFVLPELFWGCRLQSGWKNHMGRIQKRSSKEVNVMLSCVLFF